MGQWSYWLTGETLLGTVTLVIVHLGVMGTKGLNWELTFKLFTVPERGVL